MSKVQEPFPLEGGRAGLGVTGAEVADAGSVSASFGSKVYGGASTPTPGLSPIEGERRCP